ncbi:hypothetical protein KC878_01590 [Candidatus Saccharibacteria bacterium]|nr:hypothetical protein [Candidatus Saccharibacteria bacterium]
MSQKTTVYLESDDDITAVVEQLKTANEKIVALVIPKRAEVFSSMVNMKLLKRVATQAKKQIVLITDNANVSKIAGAAGVYVAPSLRSKPAIPVTQPAGLDTLKSVEEHQLYSEKTTDSVDTNSSDSKDADASSKKKSKIKVPNFNAFRVRLILVVVGLLAIPGLWYVGFKVLPSAKVVITTNAKNLPASVELTSTKETDTLDLEKKLIPASSEQNKQQYTEDFEATGEKNIGDKASGLMTISNCKKDDTTATIPAGTVFTSGSLNYVSAVKVNLDSANFDGSQNCKSNGGHVKTITVTAQKAGDQYNLSSRSYTIKGFSAEITAFGGDMSGGSTDIATVVSQEDIDSAVQRLYANKDDQAIRNQLSNTLTSNGLIPVTDSFYAKEADPVSDVEIDEETAGGTVTLDVVYTMRGVRETDVLAFMLPELESMAGDLQVIESGVASALYKATRLDSGEYKITVSTTGVAGLVLEKTAVFEEIKGRPADEAAAELRGREGITSVEVTSSPFWISSIPNKQDKVVIEINGQQ